MLTQIQTGKKGLLFLRCHFALLDKIKCEEIVARNNVRQQGTDGIPSFVGLPVQFFLRNALYIPVGSRTGIIQNAYQVIAQLIISNTGLDMEFAWKHYQNFFSLSFTS